MSEVLQIGRYQLENLLRQKIKFAFIDLSRAATEVGRHELLTQSVSLSEEELRPYLKSLGLSPDAPIVLVCEDGVKSVRLSEALEAEGYQNVYVVRGGSRGLSSG